MSLFYVVTQKIDLKVVSTPWLCKGFLFELWGLDTFGRFSAILYKGDNFCDLLLALLYTKIPSEKESTRIW